MLFWKTWYMRSTIENRCVLVIRSQLCFKENQVSNKCLFISWSANFNTYNEHRIFLSVLIFSSVIWLTMFARNRWTYFVLCPSFDWCVKCCFQKLSLFFSRVRRKNILRLTAAIWSFTPLNMFTSLVENTGYLPLCPFASVCVACCIILARGNYRNWLSGNSLWIFWRHNIQS